MMQRRVSNALHDLRLGLAEYRALKAGKDKTLARRVVLMILWDNRDEIIAALETVNRLSRQLP
jgi:hypothetical protein